jgi:uncharacterized protein YxjI
MTNFCTKCGKELLQNASFCSSCGNKVENYTNQQKKAQQVTPQPQQSVQPTNIPPSIQSSIWYQNYYRIRKKVVTVGNKYWIEDYNGNILGYCRQKLFKLKEDIRIYTDESQSQELFCIKQKQILDAFGNFGVIDSNTGTLLGSIKREWLSSAFAKDKYEIFNQNNQLIGKIEETSTGSALARKYLPGGALIPEKMTLELNGVPVAEINQSFKIIGDIWEMTCKQIPPDFDRRVLLATMLLMGTIERSRK